MTRHSGSGSFTAVTGKAVRPERSPGSAGAESRGGLDPGILDRVRFDDRGLVPVIAQEEDGTVLMLAWANRVALETTVRTGQAHYWSRSRKELWRKGATSGHVQEVVGVQVDCDGDTVLYRVHQTGPACHTGTRSCFTSR